MSAFSTSLLTGDLFKHPTSFAWLGFALCLFLTAYLTTKIQPVLSGEIVYLAYQWIPFLDIDFSFRFDGLSLLFSLIISTIGALIFFYSAAYFKNYAQAPRILLILIGFMLSMMGLVLAENIITLFVFWELTTITSYLLIGTNHESKTARNYALQALLVTVAGGLAFLAGLILLGMATGSYQLSDIILIDLSQHDFYIPIFILIFIGCITKSAIFPFHFWLPNAMAAPTPISAYLHSATMVKAGLYILMRLHPTLSGGDIWFWSLAILGGITALWASLQAVRQTDLKLMLAHTTVMALGTIALFLSVDHRLALQAAFIFLLIHALYKAALFMVVGNIEKSTGTRDWRNIESLRHIIPASFVAAILAGFSMIGLPPFIGFIGKELLIESALSFPYIPLLITACVLLSAMLMASIGFFIMSKPFTGQNKKSHKKKKFPYKSISPILTLPPLFLGIAGLVFGLFATPLFADFIKTTLSVTSTENITRDDTVKFALWHGWNLVLFLSLAVIAVGFYCAQHFRFMHQLLNNIGAKIKISGDQIYDLTLQKILSFAKIQESILQNGRQRFYVMTVFATLSFLIGLTFFYRPFLSLDTFALSTPIPVYQWALCAFIALSVFVTVFTNSRMLAICALGTIGSGIALIFVVFSAPDVAMTQFMIEILLVIILTIVTLRLPEFCSIESRFSRTRLRDGVIAVISGLCVTILMLSVIQEPFDDSISRFYAENSYSAAHGRNIVNVILVDFRAIDTLGEIVVVAIAGLACYALIKLRHKESPTRPTPRKSSIISKPKKGRIK